MALSRTSKVKEIIASAKANEILAKHMEWNPADPQLKMVLGMTIKAMLAFPQSGASKEVQETILAEIEAANIE